MANVGNDLVIVPYQAKWRTSFERFRKQALQEKNDSLIHEKIEPDGLDGLLLLCILGNEVVSASACEASHYTGDPKVSARICRYHVLQTVRNQFLFCGFQMLKLHCKWADLQNFEVVYFTHDIENRALNALYQRRKKYGLGADNSWFDDPDFNSFQCLDDRYFQVTPKSKMLQYVYARFRRPNFDWVPPTGLVPR